MSSEPQPKRDSLTGWIVAVGVLLLLAAAIPIGLKLYGPRSMVMDLQGDPGGKVVWNCWMDSRVQSGVTNLPAKLVFNARIMEFTAQRTNYTGPLQLNVVVGGASLGGVSVSGTNGGVRYFRSWTGWGVSATP